MTDNLTPQYPERRKDDVVLKQLDAMSGEFHRKYHELSEMVATHITEHSNLLDKECLKYSELKAIQEDTNAKLEGLLTSTQSLLDAWETSQQAVKILAILGNIAKWGGGILAVYLTIKGLLPTKV